MTRSATGKLHAYVVLAGLGLAVGYAFGWTGTAGSPGSGSSRSG